MRSAASAPRPSDAAIDCGARISAHRHQPTRQRSTRARGLVGVRGSTRRGFRSLPALMNSTASVSISQGIRRSPREARPWDRRGMTSSPGVTPMAHCSRKVMRNMTVKRPPANTPLLSASRTRASLSRQDGRQASGHVHVIVAPGTRSLDQRRRSRGAGDGHRGGQTEVTEDATNQHGVFNQYDQLQTVAAAGTREHVKPETPAHQRRPEPIGARVGRRTPRRRHSWGVARHASAGGSGLDSCTRDRHADRAPSTP